MGYTPFGRREIATVFTNIARFTFLKSRFAKAFIVVLY